MALPAEKRRRIEGEPSALRDLLVAMEKEELVDVLVSLENGGAPVENHVRELMRQDTNPAKCKLFVRSLGWTTKAEQVREAFQEFGEIVDLVVLEKDGKSKGYGFLTFSNAEEAARALADPRKMIDGRETICNLASQPDSRAARPSSVPQQQAAFAGNVPNGNTASMAPQSSTDQKDACRLFVRSLNWGTDKDVLREVFEQFGTVAECAVIFDKDTGKSRGYGFVTFEDAASAREALRQPEKEIDGRTTYCNLASDRKRASTAMAPETSFFQNFAQMGQPQSFVQPALQPALQQQLQLQQLTALQQAQQPNVGAAYGQYPPSQQWATSQLANPQVQQNYAALLQQQQLAQQVAQGVPSIQAPSGVSSLHQLN